MQKHAKQKHEKQKHEIMIPPQIDSPLWKTRMCKFMKEGKCARGEQCRYAHTENELRPMVDFTMSAICRVVMQGYACNNINCRYAHTHMELRQIPDVLKTVPCKFYTRKGTCSMGTKCRFVHSVRGSRTKAQEEVNMGLPTSERLNSTETNALRELCESAPDFWVEKNQTTDAGTSAMYCPQLRTDSIKSLDMSKVNDTLLSTSDEQTISTASSIATGDSWHEIEVINTFINIKEGIKPQLRRRSSTM